MKINGLKRSILAIAVALPVSLCAQVDVNREKYPDYSDRTNPDWSLLQPVSLKSSAKRTSAASTRPDYVNNAETLFFPPIFNQDGGSCGSASRICYMFTYELNAYRNLNGKKPQNYYPSHFVWLLTNSVSGKDQFITNVGIPSAATYGGQTYSSQFGNQDCAQKDFGWMQGYDKWFEAMHNRMLSPKTIPFNVGTEEGRELVKNWLWNHSGDNSFHAGGVCGIGVASTNGDYSGKIPNTTANSNAGAIGKYYVKAWGTQVDHALTIVGYDDRIEFDLDGNGVAGETGKDEKGAWIIANSWGQGWGNNGLIYCPYAYGGATFNSNGTFSQNWWSPEIYKVRKDYSPLRTIKLEMDYSRRSEIKLKAGVSADINATAPEKTIEFDHFIFAGDGNNGNTNPAPEVPMLGRWADNKLHTEPMEFGYDLTDLTEGYERSMPLKYFFIVETKSWAQGSGNIYNASIIDYEFDENGVETPFELPGGKVEIKSAGNKTIISVIVYGEPYYSPQNVSYNSNYLKWAAPLPSNNKLEKYIIYKNGSKLAEVGTNTLSYYISSADETVGVSALYEGGIESQQIEVSTPIPYESTHVAASYNKSGFRIPGIFTQRYENATIEFYIKPNSLSYYNQSAGPGWGTFMMHSDYYGKFYAGWHSNDRLETANNMLRTGVWTHVALVVAGNNMTAYIDGIKAGTVTSNQYSGIGGFGDLVFTADLSSTNNHIDAGIDEIRIWKCARTQNEINSGRGVQYSGSLMPRDLVAYYKGDFINVNGKNMMREYIAGNHAEILNSNYGSISGVNLGSPASNSMSATIKTPSGYVYAGMPVKLSATYSEAVSSLKWTIADAGINDLVIDSPTATFKTAGYQTVTVTAVGHNGNTVTDTKSIYVYPEKAIDATFKASKEQIYMGESVSFIVENPAFGQMYEWSATGAETEKVYGLHGNIVFKKPGKQTVTLKVTSLTGVNSASKSIEVDVIETGPSAAFEISPMMILKGEKTNLKDLSKYGPTEWSWRVENKYNGYIIEGSNNYDFEPDICGVYDVTLTASNEIGASSCTQERALTVCNADSKNGLNFSGRENAKVTASLQAGSMSYFTVEWWMRPESLKSDCLGIGENDGTFMVKTNEEGVMTMKVNWYSAESMPGFVIPNEWHHYAVMLSGGYAYFYRDGEYNSSKYLSYNAKVPSLSSFTIGNDAATMNGQIDEFRVWSNLLINESLMAVCNGPIENSAERDDLLLYYDFNQSSGDVIDRSGKNNNGVRSGFGPDGDAWGLSKGVFCLNTTGEEKSVDVTSKYLKNYRQAFSTSGTKINTTINNRFYGIKDWTLENTVISDGITTGAHVDSQKNNCMTFTTTWDGFSTLADHKAYQTITLPKGFYTFTAKYHATWEGQCDNSYLVIADGEGLPDTDELTDAIAYTKMSEKSVSTMSNTVKFSLNEEKTVSIGLLVNISGKQCMAIEQFILEQDNLKFIEVENSATEIGTVIENEMNNDSKSIYDLQGRKIDNPTINGIYIKNGKKFYIE